jgi:hypothetical protein
MTFVYWMHYPFVLLLALAALALAWAAVVSRDA